MMTQLDHHRRAHAALDRAHVWTDLRIEYVDLSVMRSPYHEWIEFWCQTMGASALYAARRHNQAARQLTGRSADLLD